MGWGMHTLAHSLLTEWQGGTAILSPRDMNQSQLVNCAKKLRSISGSAILLDPQLYDQGADHHRLTSHDYWPNNASTMELSASGDSKALIDRLHELNHNLGCRELILPANLVKKPTEAWARRVIALVDVASRIRKRPAIRLSLPLSYKLLENAESTRALAEKLETICKEAPVRRAYLVPEHPPGDYFCISTDWIGGVLDTIGTLKQLDVDCIVGYSNQQMLICGIAGASGIAVGNWNNVRRFDLGKFSDQPKRDRRSTEWLYLDKALSEIKASEVVRANQRGNISIISQNITWPNAEIERLLKTGDTDTYLKRPTAFSHYLRSIRMQAASLDDSSYIAAKRSVQELLRSAGDGLGLIKGAGIDPESRDFSLCLGHLSAAITAFDTSRGPTFKMIWK
jgi:hypothetical protein